MQHVMIKKFKKKRKKFDVFFFKFQVTDRRCTEERWVRDLLVDGCLTYNGQYWCMCSTDLCNSGDFISIRGTEKTPRVFHSMRIFISN